MNKDRLEINKDHISGWMKCKNPECLGGRIDICDLTYGYYSKPCPDCAEGKRQEEDEKEKTS